MSLLKDFKPALMFLAKFLAVYLVGNIVYGIFIESFGPEADPVTRVVTAQTSALLNATGYDSAVGNIAGTRKVGLYQSGELVLNVFEGCNGINVMIVFMAFLVAFGGRLVPFLVYLPAGLLIIHVFNLLRIYLLFYLVANDSDQFYYYHKYVFTASLYGVVFGLWALWIYRFHEKRNAEVAA